jgi:hypothetical protein
MRTSLEHLLRARNNEIFFRALTAAQTPEGDWILVAMHLSALHLVQAVLVGKGIACSDHTSRGEYLATVPELIPIRDKYRALRHHNEQARYYLVPYSLARINSEVLPLFQAIKRHIESVSAIVPLLPRLPTIPPPIAPLAATPVAAPPLPPPAAP